jgi:SAM-dependent methyltransferase
MPDDPEPDSSMIIDPASSGSGTGETMFDALLMHFSGKQTADDLDPRVVKALRAEFERSEFFGDDMRRLWAMCERVVVQSGRVPGGTAGVINLLNLACGYCEEGAVLSAFWGRGGRRVRQFAMDLRHAEIDKARRRYTATERMFEAAGVRKIRRRDEGLDVEFIADDATRLVGYGEIPEYYDVVFIRHQNLWHDREVWQRIYEFALARIADNGILLITSYFDREHLLALELIKSLGGEILVTERNPSSRELSYPGKSVDRHVAAIARRQNP